jgi:hypothetical protein
MPTTQHPTDTARRYPTPAEIMAEPETIFSAEFLDLVADWKNEWQTIDKSNELLRYAAIKNLLYRIIMFLDCTTIPRTRIFINVNSPTASYNKEEDIITLNNTSIISALHELGHWLLGDSELLACRWSVHLFKRIFPKAFARLHWEGHLLKK